MIVMTVACKLESWIEGDKDFRYAHGGGDSHTFSSALRNSRVRYHSLK